MRSFHLFIKICILYLISVPAQSKTFANNTKKVSDNIDTVRITRKGNYYYFSQKVLGVPHIHFMSKGMKCVESLHFSKNGTELDPEMILSNLQGIHKLPVNPLESFHINDITCSYSPFAQPDTSAYHTPAVIFDAYFEDAVIETDEGKGNLIVSHVISYIPEGFAKYEVIRIRKQPYIIAKTNRNGTLYVEWFSYNTCRLNPLYKAGRYAVRGIESGIIDAARGIETGAVHAVQGIETGAAHAARGLEIGGENAIRGAEKGIRGPEIGLESATSGIGKAIFNESKMFYHPSRVMEDMRPLVFDEKPLQTDTGITIYTYHFRCKNPKANIFLIHGNGGNVSTYKKMIQTLLSGNYNVYTLDWRGYGKSGGKPEYKGVMKDTEMAFDDFLSLVRNDSLKIIVYGMSLGGQIATKLVCDRQENVDALVLDGSLSSAQNLAMDFMPSQFIRDNIEKNTTIFNQEYVAERDIQRIKGIPKLIIHSKTDAVVAFHHGERLYKNAHPPKAFWKTTTQHIRTLEELPEETLLRIDRLIK